MLIRVSSQETSSFLKCLSIGYRKEIAKRNDFVENPPKYEILSSNDFYTDIQIVNDFTLLYLNSGMKKINSSRKYHKKPLFSYETL